MERYKKTLAVAYILIVSVCCSLPFFGMIYGWGAASTENRAMTGLPAFFDVTEDRFSPNPAYTEELGEYYSDHFGFRQELVTADSWLNETIFGRSANEKVLVGREGWYYLRETEDDYTGVSALSERGVYRLGKTLDLMDRFCSDADMTFVFFAAPNKNSVYPDYMPWNIRRSSSAGNLDRLTRTMRTRPYYLDIKSVLGKKAEEEPRNLYLRNDSHWNNLGALAAYNAIQDNLNTRITGVDYLPIEASALRLSRIPVTGDLTAMLYPAVHKTDVQYDLGLPENYSSSRPLHNLMESEINTTCQSRTHSLMCWRDSFFNALIPMTSNAFGKVRYIRNSGTSPYDLTAAKSGGFDIVIAEIAERNLPDILYSVPRIDAPKVNSPKASKRCEGEQRCSFTDDGESLILFGKIGDWAELDTQSNIYLELRSESDQSIFYEAFPIFGGDSYADDGFSVRVSKCNLKNDGFQLFLHVGDEEVTRYTELLLH